MSIKLKDFVNIETPDDILEIVRNNFYTIRKNKKLSREKLSQISGVNVGVIRRFEENKTITLSNLIALSFALDSKDCFKELFKIKEEIKIYE